MSDPAPSTQEQERFLELTKLLEDIRFAFTEGGFEVHYCERRAFQFLDSYGRGILKLLSPPASAGGAQETLREALQNLVTKLDAMEKPLNGACVIASIHGMPYIGPTWSDELSVAKALIALTPAPETGETT